jgi:hypothetical protein
VLCAALSDAAADGVARPADGLLKRCPRPSPCMSRAGSWTAPVIRRTVHCCCCVRVYMCEEYFYTKVQHLNWMLESIAADIRQGNQPWQGGAIDKAHQLIPIQKFMTRCGMSCVSVLRSATLVQTTQLSFMRGCGPQSTHRALTCC